MFYIWDNWRIIQERIYIRDLSHFGEYDYFISLWKQMKQNAFALLTMGPRLFQFYATCETIVRAWLIWSRNFLNFAEPQNRSGRLFRNRFVAGSQFGNLQMDQPIFQTYLNRFLFTERCMARRGCRSESTA